MACYCKYCALRTCWPTIRFSLKPNRTSPNNVTWKPPALAYCFPVQVGND